MSYRLLIIINSFFATYSIYTDKCHYYSFSNEQVVSKITELLGLGVGQYLNRKRVQMLGNPIDYLTRRNAALAAVGAKTSNTYTPKLDDLANLIAGEVLVAEGDSTEEMVNA